MNARIVAFGVAGVLVACGLPMSCSKESKDSGPTGSVGKSTDRAEPRSVARRDAELSARLRAAACSVPPLGDDNRPAVLYDDLGDHHYAVTTSSAQAQEFFDQGLRLVYGFNHDEARVAFREAARIDPTCPMAWWGIALTLGSNYNLPTDEARMRKAYESIQNALAVADRATARERALIEALAKRYPAEPPKDAAAGMACERAYSDQMRVVHKTYTSDMDIATLYAESMMNLRPWDLWTQDGRPQPGTLEIVETLEKVLARAPEHPGANHYYIHAVEAGPQASRAVAAADRLGTQMPGAGHLVHMPSHIYLRVGRYGDAAEANRKAVRVDEAYVARINGNVEYTTLYVNHNYHFLSFAAMSLGKSAESIKAARDMRARVSEESLAGMKDMDFTLAWPAITLARFGKYSAVLAEPEIGDQFIVADANLHFARGVAHVGLGNISDAERELELLRASLARVEAEGTPGYYVTPVKDILSCGVEQLAGRIAAAHGDVDGAIEHFEAAIQVEDQIKYMEPPFWAWPTRQVLGQALLAADRAADAEPVFREDLRHWPNNGWSLYGLAAAQKATEARGAAETRRRFDEAWAGADIKIDRAAY